MAAGLTLQELADLVGMTPRNVRAYQSRGLLPPPLVDGRIAHYDAHHVARLVLVRSLQEQGFNLEGIRRIIEMTSLYAPVVVETGAAPQEAEAPLGEALNVIETARPGSAAELMELGILRRDGDRVVVPASLAGLAARAVEDGMPVAFALHLLVTVSRVAYEAGRHVAELAEAPGVAKEDLVAAAKGTVDRAVRLAFEHGASSAAPPAAGPPA